jgi:S1-C subfamily serine protease
LSVCPFAYEFSKIEKVFAGMPAQEAGLRRDDIITEVNGEPIYDADGLILQVSKQPVAAVTQFTVLRNGQVLQKSAELVKSPANTKRVVTMPNEAWRGMRIDYTSAMGGDFLIRNESLLLDGNIAVSEVEEGSPAYAAGLRPEMIISHVGDVRVLSPKGFWSAVSGKTGSVKLREVRLGTGQVERPTYTIEPPTE